MTVLLFGNILTVNANSLAKAIAMNNRVARVLDGYFEAREDAFSNGADNQKTRLATATYSNLSMEDELAVVESVRNKGIQDFIDRCDIDVVNVTTTYSVGACESIDTYQNSEYISCAKYSAYEWTCIEYTEDGTTIDNMGFGTVHEITVGFNGKDYVIISDEYNESDISGVCTVEVTVDEIADEEVVDIEVYRQEREAEATASQANAGIALASYYNSDVELDIEAFIEYADEWVGHTSDELGASFPQNYNPAYYYYYYYTGNDCVNYASQCLRAAGMNMDTSGSAVWWSDVPYNSTPVAGTTANSSATWRSISSFEPYWVDYQGFEESAFNVNDLTPGCVIINSDKDHVMVCVGYNSSGRPVVNGHTNDRYHMLASGFTGARYVIRFTNESPSSYTTISSSTTQKSGSISSTGAKNYYKFVPSSTGFYDIYTESSIDTIGSVHKETTLVMNGDSYDITSRVALDDDGNDGSDFWMRPYLTAGETYYIEVSANSTGSYILYIE